MTSSHLSTCLVYIACLFPVALPAQTWTSIQQFGDSGGESCQALTIDSNDNIYLSGGFNADFSLGNQTLVPVGDIDIYLTQLNENGEVQWVVSGGSVEDDEVVEVITDGDNNVYWTGMYWLDADFGDTTLSVESSSRAIFMIKYSPNGELIWAQSFDGTNLKQISDIAIGNDNDLYFTGYFEETLILDEFVLTATANTDMFVAKMTNTGEMLWASQAGLEGDNFGINLAITNDNQVVVGGHYEGQIAFQSDTIQSNTPDLDVFIAKFDANGEAMWGRKAGGVFPSELTSIVLDEANNVYATGTFLGVLKLSETLELQTDGFNKNVYLFSYDENGTPLWAKSIGGDSDEEARAMILNQQTIAMTGNFMGNMLLDDFSITSNSALFNGFVAGFSLNGETKWLEKMAASELLLSEEIAANSEAQIFTAGIFTADAIFNDTNYPSNGSFDIFLAALNPQITSLEELEQTEPLFSLFPNPARHTVFIRSALNNYTLKLYNSQGHLVKSGSQLRQIDTSYLSKGLYYLHIKNEQFSSMKKLLIY